MDRAQPHVAQLDPNATHLAFQRTFVRRILFGTAAFEDSQYIAPKAHAVPIATLSAATNFHLIRRRNANANPALPLQFDGQQLVDRILRTVSEAATAGRTLAQREENRIYCWYEGWLPDEADRPTTQWEHAWTDSNLLRDTYPAAAVALQPPFATGLIPRFDINRQDVTTRIRPANPPLISTTRRLLVCSRFPAYALSGVTRGRGRRLRLKGPVLERSGDPIPPPHSELFGARVVSQGACRVTLGTH